MELETPGLRFCGSVGGVLVERMKEVGNRDWSVDYWFTTSLIVLSVYLEPGRHQVDRQKRRDTKGEDRGPRAPPTPCIHLPARLAHRIAGSGVGTTPRRGGP